MTQRLEVVHRQPLGCSQIVIAAKLNEPAQRSNLSLGYAFDSTRQTVLLLHGSFECLYFAIFSSLDNDLYKVKSPKSDARLTFKKKQITLDELHFLRRKEATHKRREGTPGDLKQENHIQPHRFQRHTDARIFEESFQFWVQRARTAIFQLKL